MSLVATLLTSAQAGAVGATVAEPPASVQITELRTALTTSGGRQTTWAQLRAKGNAKAFVWVLPMSDTAVLDAGTSTFFDALEDATAPRIRAPGTPPDGATCKLSKTAETNGNGDAEPYLFPDTVSLAPTFADVSKTLDDWGFEDTTIDAPLGSPPTNGYVLLRFTPPGVPFATLTVRLSDDGAAGLQQSMVRALPTLPLHTTTYVLGPSRASFSGASITAIPASSISWRDASRTTYREVRDSLLANTRAGLVFENADLSAIGTTKMADESTTVPSLIDAYLMRARDRAEATFVYEDTRADVFGAYATGELGEAPCPRGDLAGKPSCAKNTSVLALDDDSDDLAFALRGSRVLTRFAGIVGPNERGIDAPLTLPGTVPGETEAPVIRTPTAVWSLVCSGLPSNGAGSSTGAGGVGSGYGKGNGSGSNGQGGNQGQNGSVGSETETAASAQPASNVTVLCDGSSRNAAGDGACSSGSDASGDSCGSNSDGSDSCSNSDGSDSCSSSDGGDSCSGSDGGGDSCSNADGSAPSCSGGSTGGDSCGNCTAVGGKRSKRLRLSPIGLGAAFVACIVRRRSRPRRGSTSSH